MNKREEQQLIEEREDNKNITSIVCAIIPYYTLQFEGKLSKSSLQCNTKNVVCLAKQIYTLIKTDNLDDSKNQQRN